MPYWRLSGFYLFYFGTLGALIPFWGLYLKYQGFSPSEIGELVSILIVTKLVSPMVLGWLADHSGQGMRLVHIANALAALSFVGVFFVEGYWQMALLMVAFSLFWNATIPQFEATTMNFLGDDTHRYSSIRLWGSVGFIAAVVLIGWLLDHVGAAALPWVVLALLTGIYLSGLLVPVHNGPGDEHEHVSLRSVLLRPEVLAFFAVFFLIQLSHGSYYAFFSIYLEGHGYSKTSIGYLWALGVVAEIGLFLIMHRLLYVVGLTRLLFLTLALTGLRWVLTAHFVDSLAVVLFAQLLHAFSFGVAHAIAIHLVHRFFTGRTQVRGQALYSSISFGAGGAVGAYASGQSWELLGEAATYDLSAATAFLALLIAWVWLRDIQRHH